jgi:hypothetical protein
MISLLNNKPFKCRKYTSELYLMLKLNLSYEHLRRMWVARARIELLSSWSPQYHVGMLGANYLKIMRLDGITE